MILEIKLLDNVDTGNKKLLLNITLNLPEETKKKILKTGSYKNLYSKVIQFLEDDK